MFFILRFSKLPKIHQKLFFDLRYLIVLCVEPAPYLSTCQAENTGDSVFLNFEKP